jgi:hypothetical protein
MTKDEKKELHVLMFSMTDYNVSRYSARNSKYEKMSDKRESLLNRLRAKESSLISNNSVNINN